MWSWTCGAAKITKLGKIAPCNNRLSMPFMTVPFVVTLASPLLMLASNKTVRSNRKSGPLWLASQPANKPSLIRKSPGLLQPLPVPTTAWYIVSMHGLHWSPTFRQHQLHIRCGGYLYQVCTLYTSSTPIHSTCWCPCMGIYATCLQAACGLPSSIIFLPRPYFHKSTLGENCFA